MNQLFCPAENSTAGENFTDRDPGIKVDNNEIFVKEKEPIAESAKALEVFAEGNLGRVENGYMKV